MSFLFIAHKPNEALGIPRLYPVIPDLRRDVPFPVVFVNSHWGMLGQFVWPRSVHWSDLPFVSDPVFRHVEATSCTFPPVMFNPIAASVSKDVRGSVDLDTTIASASRVVLAIPDEPSEVHVAENFLRNVLGERYDEVPKTWVDPVYAPCREARAWGDVVAEKLHVSIVMKRFLYSYSVNACMLFGRAFEEARLGIASSPEAKSVLGSSSALQFLYHLRRRGPMTEKQARHEMENWEGTGRYSSNFRGLSTARSRHIVTERLIKTGLVELRREADSIFPGMAVSAAGNRFLDSIHPASEDPDQHFRVRGWCSLPQGEAIDRVDRYIVTYFKRQKRGNFAAGRSSGSIGR